VKNLHLRATKLSVNWTIKSPEWPKAIKKIAGQLLLQNTEEYPFQNPYYWDAFIASGH
jgi:hypothetical protein